MVEKTICILAVISCITIANEHLLQMVLDLPVVHRERMESSIPWSAAFSYEFHLKDAVGLGAELGFAQLRLRCDSCSFVFLDRIKCKTSSLA